MNFFAQSLYYFALAVLGLALPAIATAWLARHGIRAVREAARRLHALPLALRMAVVCLVVVLVVRGSTKTNSPPMLGALRPILANAPRTVFDSDIAQGFQLVGVATNAATDYAMPDGADEYAPWRLRGAADDWFRLDFGGWSFLIGTNVHSSFEVFTDGTIRPGLRRTSDAVVAVGRQLSAIPGEARFWHSCGTNHSRLLTWEHFAEGRHPVGADYPPTYLSAQLELCGSGDFVVRSNEVETAYRHIEPFDWDGDGICNEDDPAPFSCDGDFYGQTAERRAAVDAAVGRGELNGLYRFTATFHEGLCRRTLLSVGGERIVVREPGSYTFLLAKGVDYEFETEPFTTNVTYTMADDISPFPPLQSQVLYGFGNWSVETGDRIFIPEMPGVPGSCNWLPTFYGWPNVNHVFPGYEEQFEAVLEDYVFNPLEVPYGWHSDDQNIVVVSTNGIAANVVFKEVPRWRKSKLTTTAQIGTNVLRSDLEFTYGTEEDPQPLFDITAPEVVFVNDDDRTSRYYRVTMTLDSPKYPAVATVAPLVAGDSAPRLFYDIKGEPLPESEVIELRTDRVKGRDEFVCFLSCTNIGPGTVSVVYRIDDDDAETLERQFEVIEPLQKLVCTDPVEGDGFYNPSCLVAGTNAWLKVGCRGNFCSNDVQWKVVSGPGRIVETNGFQALVEPTSQYNLEEVVVEARFGHDSPIQPKFTLPVRKKIYVPVIAYIVEKADGTLPTSFESVTNRVKYANKVFSQAGVQFFMAGSPNRITNSFFSVISEKRVTTNSHGRVVRSAAISPQVIDLVTNVPPANAIRIFCVDKIVNGTRLAFSMPVYYKSCVFSRYTEGKMSVFPHEFGHILGLNDIYSTMKHHPHCAMDKSNSTVGTNVFFDIEHDWWFGDEGRGFYQKSDSHRQIIDSLLMHGNNTSGVDIPQGHVWGLAVDSTSITNIKCKAVGASMIQWRNQ